MKKKQPFSTARSPHRTILVGLSLQERPLEETHAHLQELEELCRTRMIIPLHKVIQRRQKFDRKTNIGKGKVEEIAQMVAAENIDSVLFDDQLSPSQVKNLEKKLGVKVWDRTLLILEIFAMHARTVAAKTQVELAQYQYLFPRLTRMWSHLSRQSGGRGAGMQGTGEKELETDRRIVQRKIHLLKQKLEVIARQAMVRRSKRSSYPKVALVGYTNAGKSTLMQKLAKANVLVENKLFATLTTTVRKVVIDQMPFLLADTVGFIRKLPHTLVACFKSTLAEVCEADLLLHVVDLTHPHHHKHIEVVTNTLKEIGAHGIPTLLILNKVDALQEKKIMPTFEALVKGYQAQYKIPVVAISAKEEIGMEQLRKLLYTKVAVLYQHLYPQNSALANGPVVQWTEQEFPKL